MRSFKNLFLLLISATLIIVFQGCNKSPTGSEGEDTDEIKLSENTVILADSTVNKIAQELGDSVIYFNKDAQEILQLEDGDVIVSSVGEGFLRKVKETKEEGDYIIVRTEYAALEDAINKGELSISDIKLDFQNMRIDYKRRGVRLKSRGDLLEVDFNTLLYEDPETGAEVQSFGRTLLGASIDTFGASFLFGLQSLKFGLEVYHSETLGVEISKACNFEGREKIASFTLSPFIVYVGIPIVITPHIDLYIGAALNVQGAVNSTICKDDTIVGGIVYNKGQGWSTYSDYKKYFSYALPSVSSSAEAKVYAIAPEISLQVYELIGPYAQMEGYGKIEVNPQATPWWILYGGFEVEGGVKMEILAWDVTWSGSIYSKEWELASAESITFYDDFSTNTSADYQGYLLYRNRGIYPTFSTSYDAANERLIIQASGGYSWNYFRNNRYSLIQPNENFEVEITTNRISEWNTGLVLSTKPSELDSTSYFVVFGLSYYSSPNGMSIAVVKHNGETRIYSEEITPEGQNHTFRIVRENEIYSFYRDSNLLWQGNIDEIVDENLYVGALTKITSGSSGIVAKSWVDNFKFEKW